MSTQAKEYRVCVFDAVEMIESTQIQEQQRILNRHASEGWELVTVLKDCAVTWMYLQRPYVNWPRSTRPIEFIGETEKAPSIDEADAILAKP